MKVENRDRIQDLLKELNILEGYASTKNRWEADEGDYRHTVVTFPNTIGETGLYSYRGDSMANAKLIAAMDNVETIFMECVNERIINIVNELEKL